MTTPNNPSLPQPPFYSIPNINNLRDAALFPGGLPTSSGHKIRPGILFRSAEVSKLDRAGWHAVKAIGVGHVFDLRSKPEVDKGWRGITQEESSATNAHDVRPGWIAFLEAEGVRRDWVPVFADSDYSPERLAERYLKYMDESIQGFVEAYRDILEHAGPAFRTILLYLARLPAPPQLEAEGTFLSNDPQAAAPSEDSPFSLEKADAVGALIHCTAGKDRTGIFFGLLFSFLGVPDQVIADEYNLTETGLAHIRDEIVGRLMLSPGFKNYMLSQSRGGGKDIGTAELAKLIEENRKEGKENGAEQEEQVIPPEVLEKGRQAGLRMVGARKESMLAALKMIEEQWGSAEAYMRKVCGLGDEELAALRRNLVVSA